MAISQLGLPDSAENPEVRAEEWGHAAIRGPRQCGWPPAARPPVLRGRGVTTFPATRCVLWLHAVPCPHVLCSVCQSVRPRLGEGPDLADPTASELLALPRDATGGRAGLPPGRTPSRRTCGQRPWLVRKSPPSSLSAAPVSSQEVLAVLRSHCFCPAGPQPGLSAGEVRGGSARLAPPCPAPVPS